MISCPDATGVIAAVASFLAEHSGNILEADQHTDPDTQSFYMRVEFQPGGTVLRSDAFTDAFEGLARKFNMTWRAEWPGARPRIAVEMM